MQKKLYRVEHNKIDLNKIYDTRNRSYGQSLGQNLDLNSFNHFFNKYFEVMLKNNISVDFLVSLTHQIHALGNIYTKILNEAIDDQGYINIYKLTKNENHKNQRILVSYINYFIQSFNEDNKFPYFNDGSILWEFILEFVRLNLYNDSTPRLTSVFFFKDIKSCDYHIQKHLNGFGIKYEVEIIDEISHFEGDMTIIDNVENQIKFDDLIDEFGDYWSGKTTSEPIKEIVFQGTYKYIKQL